MIPGLTKTRQSGQSIQFIHPSFPGNARLCPFTTLQHYKDKTA